MTITETTNEQQSSEQEVPQTAVLLQLDPSVLVGHPSNPRTKLTGIKELAQSVKLVGIRQRAIRLAGPGVKTATAKKPRAAKTGSVQAKAMEHPIVQRAQTLFNAEIRNVIDLREND